MSASTRVSVEPAPVLLEVRDRIAVVTLNRPQARNALSRDLLKKLRGLLSQAEADEDVDVVVLTGADPAFCSGLDLKELAGSPDELGSEAGGGIGAPGFRGPFPRITKPLIGAINGIAVTGGLELALSCDFLVASERAAFADTHSRVGVMPGWGLTVRLPQAIGVRRAREMSFTGQLVSAEEALAWGLVNQVVPHDELISYCASVAAHIVANNQLGVRQIRATYAAIADDEQAWQREAADAASWYHSMFNAQTVSEHDSGFGSAVRP